MTNDAPESVPTSGTTSLLRAILGLSRNQKKHVIAIYSMIGLATLIGFAASITIGQSYPQLAGLGLLAYVLGLRHGVDADHIAAIDNTTRKLMHEGNRPLTVGTWFSLGHSVIVVILTVGLVLVTRTTTELIPTLKDIGSVLGTTISGGFLLIIGIINVIIVLEIYRIFKGLQENRFNQSELEELLSRRGFMNRYFRHLFKLIRKPSEIFPIGILFGLGFDTASEIALMAISVGVGATSSAPVWMILVLPLMFACGMVLLDTSDGVTMSLAYGWAFLKPIRKIYYNLTITAISVVVAFAIGGLELLQVLGTELGLSGLFWDSIENIDFETMGFGIVGLFVACWLGSIAYYKYRFKNFEMNMPLS